MQYTAQMNRQPAPFSAPTGPRTYQNRGSQNHNNGNGNGSDNRQYQNNRNQNGQGNSNYKGKNFNPNYQGKNFNPNFNGSQGGPVADSRNGSSSSNYRGKNLDPNYHNGHYGPQAAPSLGSQGVFGRNNQGGFGHNIQGASVLSHQGGTVADAHNGNQNHGPVQGSRKNRRNRQSNNLYYSMPAKFRNTLCDVDIVMNDASDEPNDIEMPDAPPLDIDPMNEVHLARDMLIQILMRHTNSWPDRDVLEQSYRDLISSMISCAYRIT
jgi:hypothetical protein